VRDYIEVYPIRNSASNAIRAGCAVGGGGGAKRSRTGTHACPGFLRRIAEQRTGKSACPTKPAREKARTGGGKLRPYIQKNHRAMAYGVSAVGAELASARCESGNNRRHV
jgi:hypothetical protein